MTDEPEERACQMGLHPRKETATKTSCGPLYRAAKNHFTGGDPAKERLFAAGFVHGQAEKVYLGACMAAMFRPSTLEKQVMVQEIAEQAAVLYGLVVLNIREEIWICRPDHEKDVGKLWWMIIDSGLWHCYRGGLCGVPTGEIDNQFHLRQGAKEAAD